MPSGVEKDADMYSCRRTRDQDKAEIEELEKEIRLKTEKIIVLMQERIDMAKHRNDLQDRVTRSMEGSE